MPCVSSKTLQSSRSPRSEIRRQIPKDYRQAVSLLSKGKTVEGFDKLSDMGRVKLLPVWDEYKPLAEQCEVLTIWRTGDSLKSRGSGWLRIDVA